MSNVERHQQAHALFNSRDFEGVREMVSPDLTYEDRPRAVSMKNADEFIAWLGEWATALSNARVTQADYIDGGDWSIARFRGQGVNDGTMGEMPATGGTMDMMFCEIMHWTDGKADRAEIYYDQATMLTQLGVMQAPAPA